MLEIVEGETPLYLAASYGHSAAVQLLLEKGADMEVKDNFGLTALYITAMSRHEATMRILLEKGAGCSDATRQLSAGLRRLLQCG